MTVQARADRNAAILEARVCGFGWTKIAREHGVSERQAQRIYTEAQREVPRQRVRRDPEEVVEELLSAYEAALADYAALARDTKHDGTRLGAIRARVELWNTKFETMMVLGVIPSDRTQVWLTIDGRQSAQKVVEVLERHGVSEEAMLDIERAFGGDPTRTWDADDDELELAA